MNAAPGPSGAPAAAVVREGTAAAGSGRRVARRRVFYVPGFDPFPPRRYRELYRREAALQAARSGHRIAIAAAADTGAFGWQVRATIEGAPVTAEVTVLVWSDIVRASMRQGVVATYVQLWQTARVYIGSGTLWRLMRLRKGPTIAAVYPVAVLLGELALALLCGAAAAVLMRAAAAALAGAGPVVAALAGGVAGLAAGVAMLRGFRRLDGRLFAHYLMHDYAFSAQGAGRYPAALSTRLDAFRARIAAALAEDWDEVLVVGHSSGVHLAVTVLADLVGAGAGLPGQGAGQGAPVLSFLSLGQAVPMVSFLPQAQRLRGDLARLSASDALVWVDVSAPGDGCCFALCDPVAVSGVAPAAQRWPLVLSAAFSRSLSPARWRALRWRFFRLHFQYLCAFDTLTGAPGEYDYFAVTAGPLTLADRLGWRAPSPGRITAAKSRYRDVA